MSISDQMFGLYMFRLEAYKNQGLSFITDKRHINAVQRLTLLSYLNNRSWGLICNLFCQSREVVLLLERKLSLKAYSGSLIVPIAWCCNKVGCRFVLAIGVKVGLTLQTTDIWINHFVF